MVVREWKESSERSIKLEEWDEQTVGHVLRWLYSDDFGSAPPFDSSSAYPQGNPRKSSLETKEVYVDIGKTLVQDDHVYVLAQYLQLDKLKHLAFYKMQHGLNELNDLLFGPDCVAQIAHLARYVYSSTQSMTSFDEPLRKLGRPSWRHVSQDPGVRKPKR
ncbi:MAG: hypothetical protein Q9193_003853 [Seirophora villosa]